MATRWCSPRCPVVLQTWVLPPAAWLFPHWTPPNYCGCTGCTFFSWNINVKSFRNLQPKNMFNMYIDNIYIYVYYIHIFYNTNDTPQTRFMALSKMSSWKTTVPLRMNSLRCTWARSSEFWDDMRQPFTHLLDIYDTFTVSNFKKAYFFQGDLLLDLVVLRGSPLQCAHKSDGHVFLLLTCSSG